MGYCKNVIQILNFITPHEVHVHDPIGKNSGQIFHDDISESWIIDKQLEQLFLVYFQNIQIAVCGNLGRTAAALQKADFAKNITAL